MEAATAVLYYVHDPMCSWCWGYRPEWLRLKDALPEDVRAVNVMGGLAPDDNDPMPMETQRMIQGHWRKIQATLGTEFNFDFWTACQPRRDTFKACRAVLAAAAQGAEEEMIEAIQHAYYLRALNPSEPDTLVMLAAELGLDADGFRRDLFATDTEAEFRRQRQLARSLGVRSYPSLVLETSGGSAKLPVDYHDHKATLDLITRTAG